MSAGAARDEKNRRGGHRKAHDFKKDEGEQNGIPVLRDGGYLEPVGLRPGARVELLTPPSTVAAIAAGYRPLLHPSAGTGPS